jgi:hypothetical protein
MVRITYRRIVSIAHPTPLRPPLPCRWPVTHAGRIGELESILQDKRYSNTASNILAAIEYHKSFDPNALCPSEQAYFQNGRLSGEDEMIDGPFWMEAGEPSKISNA